MDNIGVFGTFGRKTLAIVLICIGDGIRDSLIHGKGKDELSMPIYPNCHHVWIESFHTIPTHFFTELLLVETSPLNEDFYPEKTTYNMKSCDIQ